MTTEAVIQMLREECATIGAASVGREGNVLAIRLHRSVTAADIDDTRGVPDAEFNPNSFLGAAELSGRQTYRKLGGPALSAGISTVVAWGQIMEQVHALKDDPESGVVKVIKRGGEPFLVYFTTAEKADAFARAVTGTLLE